ncbi:hypothetical protein CIB95_11210 [Lottiidibacillus patelloidae]|uniref:DUF2157 domain-containing protein n=1 Tax=Lottiidibacillus patelloidae TaxID=2670334 RepID=A0A263BSV3_9BACI|nr:DUF2157 domain-containing protein [Lottiidibacillus patelloidae]OZM56779.1 hypothetical protein CIB95_11210 [Lottiidibacillus patelloidae]
MSRKWLSNEAKTWTEKGIISDEQASEILSLYPKDEKSRFFKLLPIIASILFGLSILSFIASNWNGIHDLVKLAIIIVFLFGFYASGSYFIEKKKTTIGLPLIGLGVVTFGAGIILLGQTFHIITYDAKTFILWGIAGIISAYFFRSRFLFLLPAAILTFGQFYSYTTFNTFSYTILVICIILLGSLWYRLKSVLVSLAYVTSMMVQCLILFFDGENTELVIFAGLIPLAFYMIGEFVKLERFTYPFQVVPLVVGFIFTLFLSFINPHDINEHFKYLPVYLAITAVFAGATLLMKYQTNNLFTSYQLILFLAFVIPIMGENVFQHEIFYVIYLFIFSIMYLLQGFKLEDNHTINIGTFLFIFTTLSAYLNLAWEFMHKSLLFLTGGIIIVGLHYFLQKKKKELIHNGGE